MKHLRKPLRKSLHLLPRRITTRINPSKPAGLQGLMADVFDGNEELDLPVWAREEAFPDAGIVPRVSWMPLRWVARAV